MVVRILDLLRSGRWGATSADAARPWWSARVVGWRPAGVVRSWWPGGDGSSSSGGNGRWPGEDGSRWRVGVVRSLWMAATVALVVAAVLRAGRAAPAPFGGVGVLSAGYLAARKSVPSQALGTAGYVLGALYAVGLQFGPAVAALLAGHAAKRYALRTHPPGTFRRPVERAAGYYYDPATAGVADRLLVAAAVACIRAGVGAVGRLLLVAADGVEIEGAELAADDVLHYLHRDSPGYVFAGDDATRTGR